jgi:hypothetical protein
MHPLQKYNLWCQKFTETKLAIAKNQYFAYCLLLRYCSSHLKLTTMIFFGTGSKQIATELIMDKCEHCGTANSVELYLYQQYGHLFWIPTFPFRKTVISHCSHCKQTLETKAMSANLAAAAQQAKSNAKTPIWTFSGLAVIALLVIAVSIFEKKKNEKNAQLIGAPKSGDLLTVKTKDNQYTLFKISEVQQDTILIQVNNFETNKISGINDLKTKGYDSSQFVYTKKELKQMFDAGEIIDVERK